MNNFDPKTIKKSSRYLQEQLQRVKNQHKIQEVLEKQKKKSKGLTSRVFQYFFE